MQPAKTIVNQSASAFDWDALVSDSRKDQKRRQNNQTDDSMAIEKQQNISMLAKHQVSTDSLGQSSSYQADSRIDKQGYAMQSMDHSSRI